MVLLYGTTVWYYGTTVWDDCGSYPAQPQYDPNIMTLTGQGLACARQPATCDTFMDAPHLDANGVPIWSHWKLAADPAKTTYVSTSACAPVSGDESKCDGHFLKCAGLNTSAPAIAKETYDLPLSIIKQACAVKACHAIVMSNDDSGGTLYNFAPSNDGQASGYFRVQFSAE